MNAIRLAGSVAATILLTACGMGQQSSEADKGASAPAGSVPNSVHHAYTPGTDKTVSTEVSAPDTLYLQAAEIGQTAAEPTIGIANDGTAYFAGSTMVLDTSITWAGADTDIHRSTDGGLTWKSVQPNLGGIGYPPANADPMIYLDTTTGRVFTFDLAAACVFLSYSDDKGETWTSNPIACGNVPIDHQTIIAAKPVDAVLPNLLGYPNMLIWCSNRVVDGACGRSFDGGISWSPAGDPYLGANASDGACGSLGGHLAADPQGVLYVPSAHCGYPQVSVSTDGGMTWTENTVSTIGDPDTHTAVATDDAGNVYYVWMDANQKPFLSYSKDHGTTWSAPMMIAPPGVLKANFPVVRAKTPGHVAVAFPSTSSKSRTATPWDYTVTVTTDIFADAPVWISATANDPALPIHRGTCLGRCDGMWDFIDIQISSLGQVWASASDDCHGDCLTKGTAIADHDGQGIAIRQIAGPTL